MSRAFEKQIIFNCLTKSSAKEISIHNKLPSVGGKISRGRIKGNVFVTIFSTDGEGEKSWQKTFVMEEISIVALLQWN